MLYREVSLFGRSFFTLLDRLPFFVFTDLGNSHMMNGGGSVKIYRMTTYCLFTCMGK